MSIDETYMRHALDLAALGWGRTNPNPLVGAIIVRDDAVIGEGYHARLGEAHAEIAALKQARLAHHDVHGATLYVTLEPCSHQGRTPYQITDSRCDFLTVTLSPHNDVFAVIT